MEGWVSALALVLVLVLVLVLALESASATESGPGQATEWAPGRAPASVLIPLPTSGSR
jgi:hypothetical protein